MITEVRREIMILFGHIKIMDTTNENRIRIQRKGTHGMTQIKRV
jgi:hypothetical protein